ncbi:hypothetical protein SRABI133_05006 [Peribacillus simplex]|uniref:Uncharacterized protein n=1 Tax=Peribacillus simplex TaxID=1478 RepID=A0A9W4L513_9BACI|nr:hypothetical protein SRABI133_05006 [Peribacillus simplex]
MLNTSPPDMKCSAASAIPPIISGIETNKTRFFPTWSDHTELIYIKTAAKTNGIAVIQPTAPMPLLLNCLIRLGIHKPKLYTPVIHKK